MTTCCFDIAYLELFLPLTHGARIVLLYAEKGVHDGDRLRRLLEDSESHDSSSHSRDMANVAGSRLEWEQRTSCFLLAEKRFRKT